VLAVAGSLASSAFAAKDAAKARIAMVAFIFLISCILLLGWLD
jgi:hypothetical protein